MATLCPRRERYTEARNFDEARERITRKRDAVIRVSPADGEPAVVVVNQEHFEAMRETLAIYENEQLMKDIRCGVEEVKRGDTVSWEEAQQELGW